MSIINKCEKCFASGYCPDKGTENECKGGSLGRDIFKQDMFGFFLQEHKLALLDGEMNDIINFVHKHYPEGSKQEAKSNECAMRFENNKGEFVGCLDYIAEINLDAQQMKEVLENLEKENQNLFNLLSEIHNHFSWKLENKTTSERAYMNECSQKLHESINSKNIRQQALTKLGGKINE